MREILAKSDGTKLIDHSRLTSRIAVEMAKQTLSYNDEDLIEGIRLGALLHDIGKCQANFQDRLHKDSKAKIPYMHNEVGWSFLTNHLPQNQKGYENILDVTYWHHGIYNKRGSYNNIDIDIDSEDVKVMIDYLKLCIGDVDIFDNERCVKAMGYYTEIDDGNYKTFFARVCVISADRLASTIKDTDISDGEIKKIVSELNTTNTDIDVNKHKYFGNDRFEEQKSIVKNIEGTTVVKAAAGYGKTLIGLLWSLHRNKKLIWVCPRNDIARSVYKSILDELRSFGFNTISVELILTNEVVAYNKHFNGEFTSDIVITNIDSYLNPTVGTRNSDKLYMTIDSDVVFDEVHELVTGSALYSCFTNLMRVRHRLTDSTTLLLSATPTNSHILWDSLGCKTKHLPNEYEHYPAQHNKLYTINVVDKFNIDVNKTNLIKFNSISNAQKFKNEYNLETIYHSKFESVDRTRVFNYLYETYGKDSPLTLNKGSVVGTHIIQASFDISFSDLYESVISPESTIQIVGRIDRFGDTDIECTLNFSYIDDVGENRVRHLLYDEKLSRLWFETLMEHDGKKLTLNELYVIYNDFYIKYAKELKRYINSKHRVSLEHLSKIYPIKYPNNSKSDIRNAGSNKLRSSETDIFYICRYYNDNNKYTEPFSTPVYSGDYSRMFKENNNTLTRIINTMRKIDDDRYDYTKMLRKNKYSKNGLTLDDIRYNSKRSITPYIRFDKVYHPVYGVISEQLLNEFLTVNSLG